VLRSPIAPHSSQSQFSEPTDGEPNNAIHTPWTYCSCVGAAIRNFCDLPLVVTDVGNSACGADVERIERLSHQIETGIIVVLLPVAVGILTEISRSVRANITTGLGPKCVR